MAPKTLFATIIAVVSKLDREDRLKLKLKLII